MPKKLVLAFGTFDLLHEGHRFFLKKASELGDELVAVVARNKSVEKIKGRKPVHGEMERLIGVASLPFIDKAVLGKELGKKYELVKEIKPDIIALGYDQKPSDEEIAKELQKIGVKAKIVRLPAFNEHKFKSSKIRKENSL